MSATSYAPTSAAEPVLPSGGSSPAEILAMLKRRRLAMALAVLAVLAVASTVALTLAPVYRSSATILIKEQEIPQELVRSTVTSFADERIQVISQQVMTRSTLLDMVDRLGLYAKVRQRETSEEILDRMRRDIKLTPISAEVTDRRSGNQVRSTIAFSLSYDSEQAANAQKVANELTTLFLNENVKNRQQKAAETTSFLDEELARMGEHISEVERRQSDFKRRNQGRLPELSQANQVASERTYSEIQRLERDIAFADDRKRSLQSQLADTKPTAPLIGSTGVVADPQDRLLALQTQLAGMQGNYAETHPDLKRLRREIANLQAEAGTGAAAEPTDRLAKLAELGAQLSTLRQKYADDHPDVVRTRRSIAAIEASAATLAPVTAGTSASAVSSLPRKADNPVYLNLKTQIDTTSAQIQQLKAERDTLRQTLERVDARIVQTPEVEREFLELARDLDSSRARFRELKDKQMQAQVAEQLERGRKAERFTLIEPPIYPEKPYKPNRPVIVMMGAVLALALAVVTALLAEALDRTVHSTRDAMRALQVPVLAVIPPQASLARARRRHLRLRWALGGLVLVGAVGLIAFNQLYMPLDVAWYSVLRRLSN
ncbi:MAG: GNVR domain-containing protein [Leptothrix sp. (in: b-proteobacteria)]